MPPAQTTDTEPPRGLLARLGELAWQALPAIAGAIGVVGFVTLVGGAIQWVRFWSAGLPADQAVRVMPEAELVTMGAASLILFTVAGLLAVLLLYVLDSDGNASLRTLGGLFVLAVLELLVALLVVDLPTWEWLAFAAGFLLAGAVAYWALSNVPASLEERDACARADGTLREAWRRFRDAQDRYDDIWDQVRPTPNGDDNGGDGAAVPSSSVDQGLLAALRQATVGVRRARRDWERALERWLRTAPQKEKNHREKVVRELGGPAADGGERAKPDTDRPPSEEAVETALAAHGPHLLPRATPAAGVVLVVIATVGLLAVFGNDEERLLAGVILVVALLTAANFGLARATRRFAWYGVGALLSLMMFGAALNIGRTLLDPEVQPLALVRTSDATPLCGVYVTETDDRVYMGRVVQDEGDGEVGSDAGAGRMFWIPSDQIDVVSVGPLQTIDDAEVRARMLMREVLADRPLKAASSSKPATRTTVVTTTRSGRRRNLERSVTTEEEVPARQRTASSAVIEAPNSLPPCATADLSEANVDRLKPSARTTRFRQGP
jgi:hypothetical protein